MSEDIDKCKVCVHYNGEEKGCVKYISRRNAWKEMWESDKRYCLHYTVCPLVKELYNLGKLSDRDIRYCENHCKECDYTIPEQRMVKPLSDEDKGFEEGKKNE